MPLTRWMRVTAALVIAASPASAQDLVSLHYAPRQGAFIRTVLSARGTIVFREVVDGVPGIDSIVGEMSRLAGVTQRVLGVGDSVRRVETRYDSLRTRARLLGQAWRESALADSLRGPYQVELDDKLHWLEPVPAVFSGLGEWMGVQLPQEPIALRGSWTYPTAYRLPVELGQLLEISVTDSLAGSTSVSLDSVVPRSSDTLIYFSVHKNLGPVTLPALDAGDSAEIAVSGASAGSLVWSTGWQSFVSGASQFRIRGRLRGVGRQGMREADVTWLITTRLQVRI